jgi:hypothetical protein
MSSLLHHQTPQQDSLEDFPVAPLQKTAATTVRGPQMAPICVMASVAVTWLRIPLHLQTWRRRPGSGSGNSRDPVVSFFNGFKPFWITSFILIYWDWSWLVCLGNLRMHAWQTTFKIYMILYATSRKDRRNDSFASQAVCACACSKVLRYALGLGLYQFFPILMFGLSWDRGRWPDLHSNHPSTIDYTLWLWLT